MLTEIGPYDRQIGDAGAQYLANVLPDDTVSIILSSLLRQCQF